MNIADNWPSNDCSIFHLLLHYLGKTEAPKYYIFIQVSIIT